MGDRVAQITRNIDTVGKLCSQYSTSSRLSISSLSTPPPPAKPRSLLSTPQNSLKRALPQNPLSILLSLKFPSRSPALNVSLSQFFLSLNSSRKILISKSSGEPEAQCHTFLHLPILSVCFGLPYLSLFLGSQIYSAPVQKPVDDRLC